MEEGNVVLQLAVILIAAGVFTVISRVLKQPLILGYIIAGFIVGPNLGLFPQFDQAAVKQWSDLGIVFLLFALGLEFSFKKLLKVGGSALITAGTNCIGMFILGMLVGNALGWTNMESVFLGGMLSMSSTTIIIKAYDDMGLKKKPYASLIFGALVFEDLIAVLLMVLLSTMAVSKTFAGGELVWSFVKLAFFLIFWFLVGIYVLPTLFKKARTYLNDEILLLIAIGLCFGMVALATAAGFSSALGAFVMGSILAETIEGERIHKLMGSIKDLFGAIFFVSVGMMVDPAIIGTYWQTILVLTLVAMGGLLIMSTTGALLAGNGLNTAVHAGFTLAQLGEFSFIIASLGVSLGVMSDFIYPVIIAVSVITTFTTPYMIKAADPVYEFLVRKLPRGLIKKIDHSNNVLKASKAAENEWSELLKKYLLRMLLYSVVLVAILIISKLLTTNLFKMAAPLLSEGLRGWIAALATLVVMMPFLFGLAVNSGNLKKIEGNLLKENKANRWPILGLILLRLLVAIVFVLLAIETFVKVSWWFVIVVVVLALISFILARSTMRDYLKFEDRFFANLNQREELAKKSAPISNAIAEKMNGYDVHIESVEVSPDFKYIGLPLREMPFRKSSGVNIVNIVRGSTAIVTPMGDEIIYPGDRLLAVGDSEQLESFRKSVADNTIAKQTAQVDYLIEKMVVSETSPLAGKTLRKAQVRNNGCTIISVLHNELLVTNPSADYKIEVGDTIWIAGEKKSVEWFK